MLYIVQMDKPHARPIAVAVNIYPNTLSDKLKMHQ